MIPLLLSKPTVGLSPTKPLAFEGQVMDPLVSVPMVNTAKLAEAATPDPALEPHGLRVMS